MSFPTGERKTQRGVSDLLGAARVIKLVVSSVPYIHVIHMPPLEMLRLHVTGVNVCSCYPYTHQKRKYIYFKEKLFLPPENGKPTSHAINRVPQDKNTLMFYGK